jgi:RNA polymerase sigma-70 factor (ECF subfamily)
MITFFTFLLNTDDEKNKLTQIYGLYYGTMLYTAKRILSDHALAEDAVSNALLVIIKNLHKIKDVSCHKTRKYIVIIVESCSINLLNKCKRYKEECLEGFELDDGQVLLDDLTMREACDSIVKQIKLLPKTLSDTLYLSLVLEHSNEEISKILNISNDAVRKRLSRAKARLRKL